MTPSAVRDNASIASGKLVLPESFCPRMTWIGVGGISTPTRYLSLLTANSVSIGHAGRKAP